MDPLGLWTSINAALQVHVINPSYEGDVSKRGKGAAARPVHPNGNDGKDTVTARACSLVRMQLAAVDLRSTGLLLIAVPVL